MIEIKKFKKIADEIVETICNRDPTATQYIKNLAQSDAHLASRVLTAARNQRLFQVSISESLSSTDAFFKTTGLEDAHRLLQVTYPLERIDYDEVAAVFSGWVVRTQSEKWLIQHYKNLF
ncbi:MAG: hypothetical protein EOP50_04895 [Sphingobacteriales bacterium]|nr:MAG: hypothetical protein EOP50_04895 [Sphingobacteriales bacterium]